uniref:Uncharacterized protein n=1 Tax=Clandestinovirus TaxID=2831644 RepID=A0A8F8PMT3_9VIRU|nr:hypothetical protein KOM_12_562 [Clandestinovirus]
MYKLTIERTDTSGDPKHVHLDIVMQDSLTISIQPQQLSVNGQMVPFEQQSFAPFSEHMAPGSNQVVEHLHDILRTLDTAQDLDNEENRMAMRTEGIGKLKTLIETSDLQLLSETGPFPFQVLNEILCHLYLACAHKDISLEDGKNVYRCIQFKILQSIGDWAATMLRYGHWVNNDISLTDNLEELLVECVSELSYQHFTALMVQENSYVPYQSEEWNIGRINRCTENVFEYWVSLVFPLLNRLSDTDKLEMLLPNINNLCNIYQSTQDYGLISKVKFAKWTIEVNRQTFSPQLEDAPEIHSSMDPDTNNQHVMETQSLESEVEMYSVDNEEREPATPADALDELSDIAEDNHRLRDLIVPSNVTLADLVANGLLHDYDVIYPFRSTKWLGILRKTTTYDDGTEAPPTITDAEYDHIHYETPDSWLNRITLLKACGLVPEDYPRTTMPRGVHFSGWANCYIKDKETRELVSLKTLKKKLTTITNE